MLVDILIAASLPQTLLLSGPYIVTPVARCPGPFPSDYRVERSVAGARFNDGGLPRCQLIVPGVVVERLIDYVDLIDCWR